MPLTESKERAKPAQWVFLFYIGLFFMLFLGLTFSFINWP